MQNEKFIFKLIDDDNKLRNEINESFMTAIKRNIGQMKNLIVQMVLVSVAIIGFSIPIFNTDNLIKDHRLMVGAIVLLSVVVLYGFYYLTRQLSEEKRSLVDRFNTYSHYLDELVIARNKFVQDLSEEGFKKYKIKQEDVLNKLQNQPMELQQEDHGLTLLYWSFFLALVLIVISFTDTVAIAKELLLRVFS